MPKNKKLALNSRIQTYQILTNNDEVCIPSVSIILLSQFGKSNDNQLSHFGLIEEIMRQYR